ncbi:MAG TPA: Hsp20/alpha crystallin family protein [Gelria sp.]|nr:Hsp20/alpha crystallin family protein [Gelria sp.]
MFDLTPFRRRRDLSPAEFGRDFFRDFLYPEAWFDLGFKADIKETPTEYIVEAELPGVNKEQLVVEYRDNTLTISAEQNEEINEEQPNYVRRERRQGSINRRFYVENVNSKKIAAEYKDGLLTIIMPKLKEDKPENYRINIR